jgi:hypothetical protein
MGRSGERSLRHAPRYRRPADIEDAGWAPEILEKGPEANSSPRVRTSQPRKKSISAMAWLHHLSSIGDV